MNKLKSLVEYFYFMTPPQPPQIIYFMIIYNNLWNIEYFLQITNLCWMITKENYKRNTIYICIMNDFLRPIFPLKKNKGSFIKRDMFLKLTLFLCPTVYI